MDALAIAVIDKSTSICMYYYMLTY